MQRVALSTIYVCLAAVAASAQSTAPGTPMAGLAAAVPPKPAPAAAAVPKVRKLGPVVVQGSFRTRLESWDWFEPDSGDPSYTYSGNLFRLSVSQSREAWDWQIEAAIPVLLGLPRSAVAPGVQGALGAGANYFTANDNSRNAIGIFPKQAFIRFRSIAGNARHSLRIGRFEYADGAETTPKNMTLAAIKRDRINMRLIGHFGWTHVGRSFDGFHYQYNPKKGNFTLVGALPTRGVFQVDGLGYTNTGFGYAAYTLPWSKGTHAGDTRVFAIHYQDWRSVVKTDSRALAIRRSDLANVSIFTFGGHSVHAQETRAGTADFMFWGAGQTGRWGVLDHRGHAVAIEGGFQPRIAKKLKPWIRAGFFDGSGDGDAGDSRHDSFFQLLPTPRPFARFPFFNMMNNRDYNAALILRPHAKVTTSSEFHALSLSNRNDLWYLGGGAFQPWTFGYIGRASGGNNSLANLYDTSVEVRLRPDTTITGYFGYAQGGALTSAIYPKGKDGMFGYLEVAYRF